MDMPERFQLDRVNGGGQKHLDIKSEENQMMEPSGSSQHKQQQQLGVSVKSKAEIRKSNKPIMEKKRRARINNCLEQLKKILLENVNKDSAQHSKLEKADILEMTVKHLQQIQRRQLILAVSMDRSVLEKFRNGFSECASEIKSFISQMPELEPALRQRLSHHLEASVTKIHNTTPINLASTLDGKPGWGQSNFTSLQMGNEPLNTPFLDDLNNNQRLQMDLVPTRLPSGELAFVMPNSSHLNMPNNAAAMRLLQSNTSTPRVSAFNLVTNKSHSLNKLHHTSPPLSPISTSDERTLLRTPPSSTLSIFHSAFSQSLTGGNPFTNLSNSRMDSGYKSDTSMSELICKPAVPQQSYLELLKPKVTTHHGPGVALGPHSSESTLNLSCRDSPCSSGSSNIREMEQDKDGMWRPW